MVNGDDDDDDLLLLPETRGSIFYATQVCGIIPSPPLPPPPIVDDDGDDGDGERIFSFNNTSSLKEAAKKSVENNNDNNNNNDDDVLEDCSINMNMGFVDTFFTQHCTYYNGVAEHQANAQHKDAAECCVLYLASCFMMQSASPSFVMVAQGAAGTGKTHTVLGIVKEFISFIAGKQQSNAQVNMVEKSLLIVSVSNVVAQGIGGQTIATGLVNVFASQDFEPKCSPYTKLVLVDEYGQVGLKLNWKIHKALCNLTQNSDAPYGGLSIMFLGDGYQTTPVLDDSMLKEATTRGLHQSAVDSRNVFCGTDSDACWYLSVFFTQQYRMQEELLDITNAFVNGNLQPHQMTSLMERHVENDNQSEDWASLFPGTNDGLCKFLCAENGEKALLNESLCHWFAQHHAGCCFTEQHCDDLYVGKVIEQLEYKQFVAWMLPMIGLSNYPGTLFKNGVLCWIVALIGQQYVCVVVSPTRQQAIDSIGGGGRIMDEDHLKQLLLDGIVIAISRETRASKRKAFPLAPAFAMTVHKCQGMTLDKVIVDMTKGNNVTAFWFYTAITRVRRLEDLYFLCSINHSLLLSLSFPSYVKLDMLRLSGLQQRTRDYILAPHFTLPTNLKQSIVQRHEEYPIVQQQQQQQQQQQELLPDGTFSLRDILEHDVFDDEWFASCKKGKLDIVQQLDDDDDDWRDHVFSLGGCPYVIYHFGKPILDSIIYQVMLVDEESYFTLQEGQVYTQTQRVYIMRAHIFKFIKRNLSNKGAYTAHYFNGFRSKVT